MKKILLLIVACLSLSISEIHAQSIGRAIVDALLGGSEKRDDPTHKHIDAGGTVGLVLPQNITRRELTSVYWSAVDSRYIRVKESNKTSAVVQGLRSTSSTVVNAKYSYKTIVDGKEKTVTETFPFTITINRIEPTSITMPQLTDVGWGTSRWLPIRLKPDFSEIDCLYDSSNTNVAIVNADGSLYGVALGEADVVVRTTNGLECSTHVRCVIPAVEAVEIRNFDKKAKHIVGDEFDLDYAYSPEHAIPEVTWSSSDPEVATVDNAGHVRCISHGTTHIYVTDKTGKKNDIKLKVKKK